jgi:predicted site-specific integrase-resolvase
MTDTPPGDRILTPRQTSDMLNVAPITLNRWAREGHFPGGTVIQSGPGAHRRYRESGVRQYLAERAGGQS